MPRLLESIAVQTTNPVNFSQLAVPVEVTRQTIYDYVVLLERIFLLDTLLPWHSNRQARTSSQSPRLLLPLSPRAGNVHRCA